jgi:hypothetical protein
MVPLASGTALGIIGGVISVSLLFLWWLLRAESRDADEEEASEGERGAGRRADLDGEPTPEEASLTRAMDGLTPPRPEAPP